MGGKYEVRGAMNAMCPCWDGQFTNSLLHALLLLVRYSMQYRIVNFTIRGKEIDCGECHEDTCPTQVRERWEWNLCAWR